MGAKCDICGPVVAGKLCLLRAEFIYNLNWNSFLLPVAEPMLGPHWPHPPY